MARLAGYGGSVLVGTSTVAGIKQWDIDYRYKTVDVRGFDDGINPNPLPTVMDWGGSFVGFKDGTALALGAQVGLQLKESNTTGQAWTGSAYVFANRISVVVDGVVGYSYDFIGKGTLTVTTA